LPFKASFFQLFNGQVQGKSTDKVDKKKGLSLETSILNWLDIR